MARPLIVLTVAVALGSLGTMSSRPRAAALLQPPAVTLTNVVTFGYPGATTTEAADINDAGVIVGNYLDSAGHQHGFIYNGSTFTPVDYPGASNTRLVGITDDGTVAGFPFESQPPGPGFLWHNGTFTPMSGPGDPTVTPTDISGSGDIIGSGHSAFFLKRNGVWSQIGRPVDHPVVWLSGISSDPDPVIVGGFYGFIKAGAGFILKEGTSSTVNFPGAKNDELRDVNAAEQVVGQAFASNFIRYLLSSGQYHTLDRDVFGINNMNQVVGSDPDGQAFAATLSGPSAITQVTPAVGTPGQTNLTVRVRGVFTHFANGTTAASFGPGITVNSVSVQHANQATVNVTIDAGAAPGGRTITLTSGGEVVSTAGFTVAVDPPAIVSVSPPSGQQNTPALDVVVTGNFTHFVQGNTTASFSGGITVNAVTVVSPTQATVNLSISPDTVPSSRTVTLTTNSEVVSLPGAFTITPGTASLYSSTPTSSRRTETAVISIKGRYTHFVQGTTTADFGPGITVNSLTIDSPYAARADITISASAITGPRALTVTTGSETVQLPGALLVLPRKPAATDYDGDGRPDITVFRPTTGHWFIANSQTSTFLTRMWGGETDVVVPGNYFDSFKSDIAVFRPSVGLWFILRSWGDWTNSFASYFGTSGDLPVPADYDGDNKTDLAVYRPSDGNWYIRRSTVGVTDLVSYQWGVSDDVRVPGDYDGDGKADIAVYRPSAGAWFVLLSSSGYASYVSYQWGVDGDIPVPADYDGDSRIDVAVYRPSTGTWFIRRSSTNFTTSTAVGWGLADDVPVPGDYDGDGSADPVVYRPSTGTWFILRSSSGYTTSSTHQWGAPGDVALPKHP
jgi:FG-GAP repeat